MTSRELVSRTLDFASPERIPRQLWFLPWAELRHPSELARIRETYPDDIVQSPPFFKTPLKTRGREYEPGLYVDEWGCRFENRQSGVIGEVRDPLLKDWKDLDTVRLPVERLSVDARKVDEFCASTEAFVLARTAVRPFEQLQFLRGPANLFLDLASPPDELLSLIERIHGFYRQEMELWAGTAVDALFFADDWGGQTSLLVSPALFRRLFLPLYRDYADIARRSGKRLFMHTDGNVTDILSDLVGIGVDAVNTQLFCMDIEELGRRFAGKVTFWGEIDRQRLLPFGTPEEIRAAVERVAGALYREGGIIAQCEFGVGARPENVAAVYEAWDNLQPA
jgi:uroporphyrinogen decarboxylase